MKKRLGVIVALFGLAAISFAQDSLPRGKAETMVDGKKVVIDYGRPELEDRSLDELMSKLPGDRVWRAGENQVTTLDTATDLTIGGKTVPAGKYSLYVLAPEDGNWALLVNENLGIELGKIFEGAPPEMAKEMWPRLDGYTKNIADQEVARIPLTQADAEPTDAFTIDLSSNELVLSWGDRAWKTSIE